jgi:VWFA-related protein
LFLFIALAYAVAQTSHESSPAASAGTTFTAGAELVLVPVVVRNKTGHVSDLTQANFSVFEDGHRQRLAFVKVTNTGVVLKHENKENVFSNEVETGGDTPRVTVVVVDSANIPFGDQVQLRDSFRKFLIYEAARRGPTAVVSFQRSGMWVVQDFTTDPNVLAAVVDRDTGKKASDGQSENETTSQPHVLSILPRDMANPRLGVDDNQTLVSSGHELKKLDPNRGDDVYDLAAKNLQLREVIELELRGLNTLAQSLSGIPGRKTLIWLTGVFPFDLDDPNSYLSPTASEQYRIVTPKSGTGRDGITPMPVPPPTSPPRATSLLGTSELIILRPLYEQTMRALASANVAVYPVDTRGVVSFFPEAGHNTTEALEVFGTQTQRAQQNVALHQGMQIFARNTGGRPCYGTNAVGPCLQEIVSDANSYYLLGYYRERKNNKPGWRKVKVQVDRDGVDVLARDGYFYSAEKPDSKEARQRDIVAALQSPVNFSGLPFTVRLRPAAAAAGGSSKEVQFQLEIPPTSLSNLAQENKQVSLDVACIAGSSKDTSADRFWQTLGGTMKPEAIAKIEQDGISYSNKLRVPAGKTTLRFVVRDNSDGRTGSVIVPYVVQ